jgi:hypothetical protein
MIPGVCNRKTGSSQEIIGVKLMGRGEKSPVRGELKSLLIRIS